MLKPKDFKESATMSTFSFIAQNVNGDPLSTRGDINIVNNSTSSLSFFDTDGKLGSAQPGETVSVNGGPPQSYQMLGTGNVRGDPLQKAAFIRLADGTTFAIDLNADGDQTPDLANGNTKLKVSGLDASATQEFPFPPTPVCFAAGTRILTHRGPIAIETLAVGDLVSTADNGPQPIRFIQTQHVSFGDREDRNRPILIRAGSLGPGNPERDLVVSPQHRMLLSTEDTRHREGARGVLCPAKGLVGMQGVSIMHDIHSVDYLHLLFDRHEILFAEGAKTESLYPGPIAIKSLRRNRRFSQDVFAICQLPQQTARVVLSTRATREMGAVAAQRVRAEMHDVR